MRQLGIDRKQLEKFTDVTNLIIDFFGLSPRWDLQIAILSDDDYDAGTKDTPSEGSDSLVNWPPHYRSSRIGIRMSSVLDLETHMKLMIHECVHLLIAPLDDFISGKVGHSECRDIIEETVSEVSNLFIESFQQVFEKELRSLLT